HEPQPGQREEAMGAGPGSHARFAGGQRMTPNPDRQLAAVSSEVVPASAAAGSADDPRLIAAMEEYCTALHAGRKPNRESFLAGHADVAVALAKCLDGLEFIYTAAPRLSLFGKSGSVAGGDEIRPSAALGDYRIVVESLASFMEVYPALA